MVPRGLEPRTLRLLAVRSNQLSYETHDIDRKYQVIHLSAILWSNNDDLVKENEFAKLNYKTMPKKFLVIPKCSQDIIQLLVQITISHGSYVIWWGYIAQNSAAGNWTRVFRVTGGNTHHYTTADAGDEQIDK